jgi:UDP-N-acetyl-D-mannosaminuronic acid dehydrogenase
LRETVSAGRFVASESKDLVYSQSDVIVVTVGTPTGSQYQFDYSQLHSALREVAKVNIKGKAIIMRSTSVPGTLKRIVLPLLSRESGLKLGDFALATCPERILEGKAIPELYELPEIVGAADDLSGAIASELLRKINPEKKISVTTPTGAELAKLFTNIYRYVNFALANEFAVRAERYGEDAHEVIRIANNGYSRSHIPIPGFAGGPCLSKDGLLLDNNTTFSSMISAAWKLNEAVPQHVAESILDELGSLYGVKVGLLGLAFKSESDDLRLSPSVKLGEILTAYGAKVQIHDPFVKETLSLKDALRDVEVVILATNHRSFQEIASLIDNSGCRMVYDVWGMFEPKQFLKAKYRRFGRA